MAGRTVKAVQARRAIGADADWELYELIDERPRLEHLPLEWQEMMTPEELEEFRQMEICLKTHMKAGARNI
ncbi:MAG: hypothetical protein WCG94_01690 [Methanothrix sp.]